MRRRHPKRTYEERTLLVRDERVRPCREDTVRRYRGHELFSSLVLDLCVGPFPDQTGRTEVGVWAGYYVTPQRTREWTSPCTLREESRLEMSVEISSLMTNRVKCHSFISEILFRAWSIDHPRSRPLDCDHRREPVI